MPIQNKYYRAINFDLNTAMQKRVLGNVNADYALLEKWMKQHGFSHSQGSGYLSKVKLSKRDLDRLIFILYKENKWLEKCCKVLHITNVMSTETFDGNQFYKAMEKIQDDELSNLKI